MRNNTKTIAMLNHEIKSLEDQIRILKEERIKIIRATRHLAVNDEHIELLTIILKNPGIDRDGILQQVPMDPSRYQNLMTSLVRRGFVVNVGTRREPLWYVSTESKKV